MGGDCGGSRDGGDNSWISALYLPPPQEVVGCARATGAFFAPLSWQLAVAPTSARASRVVLGGWLAAGAVGLPLGIAMGWWPRVRWIAFPVFQLLRPVPPLAWIPLAIVWLGIGDGARVFVVFIAAIVPWVLNAMQAVVFDRARAAACRRQPRGLGARQVLTRVVCRTALPTLLAGARIALGNAWTTLVAAELLAATAGLGYIALNASRTLEMGILLVAMAIIGALGALLSLGMLALSRVAWHPWSRAGAVT